MENFSWLRIYFYDCVKGNDGDDANHEGVVDDVNDDDNNDSDYDGEDANDKGFDHDDDVADDADADDDDDDSGEEWVSLGPRRS